jgi:UDP-N-acetylglucosamine:LPS N-acetylglucosamine transferase
MRKLTIVFHDAGGGHRSAAEAVSSSLAQQDIPWKVQLLNLQELLDSLDLAHKITGLRVQDTYNQILRRGWTKLTPQLLMMLQTTIRLYHRRIVRMLKGYWAEHPTDLVLSVIPHFNRALSESLACSSTRPPFVTLITDLADYPPHFWLEKESEYVIAGTKRAKEQALERGLAADHVFLTSGMLLKPSFYQPAVVDVAAERQRLGLDPEITTGIVMFGGHGSHAMIDIVEGLDRTDARLQLILLCGHNRGLADELRHLQTRIRLCVQEFTPRVEHFMALGDLFIGKPGPGSISEALQMNLPVVVECNSRTLPQERYNAEWLIENGYGTVITDFREIGPCIRELLKPDTLGQLRRNVSAYSNRALLEVPRILDECWRLKRGPLHSVVPAALPAAELARA